MSAFDVIVMAAGKGTRMRSATPKILHEICGRPMVAWTVGAARAAGARRIVVVRAPMVDLTAAELGDDVLDAVQEHADGTAGAVAAGLAALAGEDNPIVAINCDHPLIAAETIGGLVAAHTAAGAAVTVATAIVGDPSGYGRIVRGTDGHIDRIVETKVEADATVAELEIDEVNSGVYCFGAGVAAAVLPRIGTANAQRERYLPDAIAIVRGDGAIAAAYRSEDPGLMSSVNDRRELMIVTAQARRRILERHALAGVTIADPATTSIDVAVSVGQDTVIEPGTVLRGETAVGAGAVVGPNTTVIDSRIGDGAIVRHSLLDGATVGDEALVGPFAHLRPGAVLERGAKAGTFVEIKGSTIGAGAKVPHLAYVGDADVGAGANLGAGTITANYDGRTRRKSRTTIGPDVRTGVLTALVAPVTLGARAYTAAGTVVTGDVPAAALAVSRGRQRNVEDYADR